MSKSNLTKLSLCILKEEEEAYLSKALGCQTLVRTSDDYFLFLKRSEEVATYKSFYQTAGIII